MDAVAAQRDKDMATMQQLLNQYRKTDLSPPEIEALKQFDAGWPVMEAACKPVRELSYNDAGDGANNLKALELMRTDCQPKFQAVDDTLSKLVDINQKLADKAILDAGEAYSLSKTELTIAIILVGIVLAALGFAIHHGIGSSLQLATAALSKIGNGDFSGTIAVQGKDEVAAMMRSLSGTQQQLRQTMRDVMQSAQTVASTAEELAASTEQVSASIEQQVDATAVSAASVEQLTVSISHISQNAATADGHAQGAGAKAKVGNQDVQAAKRQVQAVNDSVAKTAADLELLSTQAGEIDSIATVIKEVADQTNLLALNAAIEAARAGEQGRGFAVVADEVRKLAERTTHSASEITTVISKIQSGARDAVDSMNNSRNVVSAVMTAADRASTSIAEVESSSNEVISVVGDIAAATREQSMASTDLAKRIEVISQVSEENRATISSVSQAAQELATIAEKLQLSMERFRVN